MKPLIDVFLVACTILSISSSLADEPESGWLEEAHAQIKSITDDLATSHGSPGELSDMLAKSNDSLAEIVNQAQQCVQVTKGTLQKLQGNVTALGTAGETSDGTVTQAKQDLTHSIDAASARLASCQAVLLEATTLAQQVTDLRAEQLKNYLLARSQPIWTALGHALVTPVDWQKTIAPFLASRLRIHTLSWSDWLAVIAATAMGWLLGLPAGRFFQRLARSVRDEKVTYRFYQSVCACLASAGGSRCCWRC